MEGAEGYSPKPDEIRKAEDAVVLNGEDRGRIKHVGLAEDMATEEDKYREIAKKSAMGRILHGQVELIDNDKGTILPHVRSKSEVMSKGEEMADALALKSIREGIEKDSVDKGLSQEATERIIPNETNKYRDAQEAKNYGELWTEDSYYQIPQEEKERLGIPTDEVKK